MRSCWNLILSRIFFLVALPCTTFAQFSESEGTTSKGAGIGGYLFPINPGKPNHLAGTMGELRTTHFHGGIDIRTDNRIGVAVLATQDGYIYKASVSSFGYGTSLFLNHPDGKSSVYGHLDKYVGKLADLVRSEQYRLKTFEIELTFKPGEFPVKKGDIIALSGNTGSSSGPHLHFEIREGNYALNPLKFGFTEIADNIPPAPQKIALRTLDINSRINDRFGRFEFTLIKKSPTEYILPAPIMAHGRIGVELLADDRMDNSPGRCGIPYIEMFADSQKVFSQFIERVDLEETRAILALLDYKTMETRGKRYNKLYVDDGNRLDFYKTQNEGVLTVKDSDVPVKISLKDESGNASEARFQLKHIPLSPEMVLATKKAVILEADLIENILVVTSKKCAPDGKLTLFHGGQTSEMNLTYEGANQNVYLIDIVKAQPDSIKTCAGSLSFHFKDAIPSSTAYTYYSDWVDIRFPENALYDTLFLNLTHQVENGNEVFSIGKRTTPLHKTAFITLKPETTNPNKNLAVYRKEGRGVGYLGGEWSNGKVKFYTKELGDFTFLVDSLPPTITRIRIDGQSARLRIRDERSGISYYEANINGQWLLMNYDYKSGILKSDKLDPNQRLKGDFELKVVDRAGNERIFKQKIL